MSASTQFTLSLELSKILPIRSAIQYSAGSLVKLVRALRRSGSDFLVEEDLANIFGRAKIEPSLENDFRGVVRNPSFTPIHAESPIILDAGPGETVRRALMDRCYMSTVIQISFLLWMHEETTLATAPIYTSFQSAPWVSAPTIYLLDASHEVLLRTEPVDNESATIEGQECHRLKGYGATFLQRLFNKTTLVADDDPIYAETANFTVAFAILLGRSMRRTSIMDYSLHENEIGAPTQCWLGTEPWRLFDSSKLLFSGIELDKRIINSFVEKLTGARIADMAVPPGIRNYLEKSKHTKYEITKDHFIEDIKQAASWVLTFAQVVDVESCADLPLRIAPGWMFCTGVVGWEGLEPIEVESKVFFNLALKMMRKDVTRGNSIVESDGVFLTSHHGWSLFYTSVGDHDPGRVNCELLSIKRGVPTNTRTGERKYRIADGPAVERIVRTPIVVDIGDSYLSRCFTKVYKRTEHYSSRAHEFLLSIRFDIEELEPHPWRNPDERYSIYASHSQFHEALWGTIKTSPCGHPDGDGKPLPLDLGVVTVAGLTWANGNGQAQATNRICICLVKGDDRARWLVVNGLIPNNDMGALNRQVLLRCDGCCEDCAVKAASAMKGQWLVIL